MTSKSEKSPTQKAPPTPTQNKFPTNPRRKDFSTEDQESHHLNFRRPQPNPEEPFAEENPAESPIRKANDSRNMTPLHKAYEPRNFGRNTDCEKGTPYNENPEIYEQ